MIGFTQTRKGTNESAKRGGPKPASDSRFQIQDLNIIDSALPQKHLLLVLFTPGFSQVTGGTLLIMETV